MLIACSSSVIKWTALSRIKVTFHWNSSLSSAHSVDVMPKNLTVINDALSFYGVSVLAYSIWFSEEKCFNIGSWVVLPMFQIVSVTISCRFWCAYCIIIRETRLGTCISSNIRQWFCSYWGDRNICEGENIQHNRSAITRSSKQQHCVPSRLRLSC